jgi:DNA polymerase-3 subunit epsilon
MMRQIVLDTETTGLNPDFGHRIIEIGCVELIDRKLTGNHFHFYLNPEREVDAGAFKVHGISTEFLKDKPLFPEIAQDFVDFVDQSELIIHNAPFDVGFLNKELSLINWPKQINQFCKILDTLVLAKEKHPGQRNNLDALCKRYEIDNSSRQLHGALLDAEILALVYLAMTGGQGELWGSDSDNIQTNLSEVTELVLSLKSTSPVYKANEEELQAHQEFVQFLEKKSGIKLWED